MGIVRISPASSPTQHTSQINLIHQALLLNKNQVQKQNFTVQTKPVTVYSKTEARKRERFYDPWISRGHFWMLGSYFYCYGNMSFPLVGISKGSIRTSGFEGSVQYEVFPRLFVRCALDLAQHSCQGLLNF